MAFVQSDALRAAMMMTRRHILPLLWLTLIMGILDWTLVSHHAQSDLQLKSEILLRHGLLMLVLTLPCGWLLTALVGAALHLAGV
jgi:hypothetical protein